MIQTIISKENYDKTIILLKEKYDAFSQLHPQNTTDTVM